MGCVNHQVAHGVRNAALAGTYMSGARRTQATEQVYTAAGISAFNIWIKLTLRYV